MSTCIYLDNAATSWPKPAAMLAAMNDFSANIGANPGRSGHRLSTDAARIIFDARERIATLLGADDPQQLIFTRNATEGLNTILLGLLRPGDHVLTTSMEHNSVMRPLTALHEQGFEMSVVPCNDSGDLCFETLAAGIRKNTRLIAMTHASNVTGTIQPVAQVAKLAHERGILLCVDAAQTTGCIPLNVLRDEIDLLAFSGHKSLLGPQGTGGFYVRKGLEEAIRPLAYGGTGSRSEFEEHPSFMPDRFEAGTPNTIGIAGLGASAAYVTTLGIPNIRAKEIEASQMLIDGLKAIDGVRVYGPSDAARRTAVVSFTVAGISPSDLSFQLDERFGIMARAGLHCAPAAHRTIGTFPEGTVRFSLSPFTTPDEITTAIRAVESLADQRTAREAAS